MNDGIHIRDAEARGNLTDSKVALTKGIDELLDFSLFHLDFPLGLLIVGCDCTDNDDNDCGNNTKVCVTVWCCCWHCHFKQRFLFHVWLL
jgi:hypothetical protein